MKKMPLHFQVFIALILATAVGATTDATTTVFGVVLHDLFDFFGQVFLNALKMIVIPLVFSSIVVGVASIAGEHSFTRLGVKTLSYYIVTSTISILIGLFLVNVIQPGSVEGGAASLAHLSETSSEVLDSLKEHDTASLTGVFLRMVPSNVVSAAAQGQLLGLIFFAAVFGFFISKIKTHLAKQMTDFWKSVNEVMMKITLWIIKFSPYGVFALVAKVVMISGLTYFLPHSASGACGALLHRLADDTILSCENQSSALFASHVACRAHVFFNCFLFFHFASDD